MKRERRHFAKEFKLMAVNLYLAGIPSLIAVTYDLLYRNARVEGVVAPILFLIN